MGSRDPENGKTLVFCQTLLNIYLLRPGIELFSSKTTINKKKKHSTSFQRVKSPVEAVKHECGSPTDFAALIIIPSKWLLGLRLCYC